MCAPLPSLRCFASSNFDLASRSTSSASPSAISSIILTQRRMMRSASRCRPARIQAGLTPIYTTQLSITSLKQLGAERAAQDASYERTEACVMPRENPVVVVEFLEGRIFSFRSGQVRLEGSAELLHIGLRHCGERSTFVLQDVAEVVQKNSGPDHQISSTSTLQHTHAGPSSELQGGEGVALSMSEGCKEFSSPIVEGVSRPALTLRGESWCCSAAQSTASRGWKIVCDGQGGGCAS